MFENNVLSRNLGNSEKLREEQGKLHNKGTRKLEPVALTNTFQVIKPTTRWRRMLQVWKSYDRTSKHNLIDLGADKPTIRNWTLKQHILRICSNSFRSRQNPVVGSCKQRNKIWSLIRRANFTRCVTISFSGRTFYGVSWSPPWWS